MSILPKDFKVERVDMTIKLKPNHGHSPRKPVIVGFVAMSAHNLQRLLDQAKAAEGEVVFARVALWTKDNDDSGYTMSGTVSVNAFDPSALSPADPPRSEETGVWF
jgi:nicotinamidase-related amidase